MHVRDSRRVQARDCGARARPSDFAAGLICLSLIEFPSFEKAVACHESVEYLEAAAHRRKGGASELEIVIVESI